MGRTKVVIGGIEVESKDEMRKKTQQENLPKELQNTRVRMAIENRTHITVYDHSPTRGYRKAAINLVEFNDLSCDQCRKLSKSLDKLFTKYPKDIKHIYVHTPIDKYNSTNPSAFYGRIAYANDLFWKYRKALYTKTESNNIYLDTLISLGMTLDDIREEIRTKARIFYREIDADTLIAGRIGEEKAPAAYINGIRIGHSIGFEHMEKLIEYELEQIKLRE